MRTLILWAFLLAASVAGFAQETPVTEEPAKSKPDCMWYYSVGITSNPDFNINDKLLASGNHRISDIMPTVVVGASISWARYTLEMEGGFSGFWKKDDGYRLSQMPLTARGKYTLLDDEDFSIAAGVGFTYTLSDLSIYSKDVVIDMNDLNPDNNSGYIRLRNGSFFVSPSLTFALGKFNSEETRITMGYDISVSNTQWKADYGHIANPIRENGNRFYVRLQIPL